MGVAMNSSFAIWAFVILSILAANLPWFSERFLIVIRLSSAKRFLHCLIEWFLLYFVMGAMAMGLEQKINGSRHAQDWEFYVVTFCLFLVFALPGFIYRYDFRQHLIRR